MENRRGCWFLCKDQLRLLHVAPLHWHFVTSVSNSPASIRPSTTTRRLADTRGIRRSKRLHHHRGPRRTHTHVSLHICQTDTRVPELGAAHTDSRCYASPRKDHKSRLHNGRKDGRIKRCAVVQAASLTKHSIRQKSKSPRRTTTQTTSSSPTTTVCAALN